MEMNKKQYKYSSGITLVALVITIIVLIILGGIGVSMLLNGGIIGRASEAKFKTEIKALEEQMRTICNGIYNR